MLYPQEVSKEDVSLLKIMIEDAISSYGMEKNSVSKKIIIKILKEVEKLHQSEENIYNIDSGYFQWIVFIYKHSTPEMFRIVDNDIKIEQLNALKSLLERFTKI